MECKQQMNQKERCTCTCESCPRHGVCCDCVAYHRNLGQLPACLRDLATVK